MKELPGHPLLTKPLWTNAATMAGLVISCVALLLLVTFGLFSVVSPAANPYVDIVGYLILPGILSVGIFLMLAGVLVRSIRRRRLDPSRRLRILPRVDFSDPMQIRVAKYLALGLFAVLPIAAVTGYHGYHFTDSTQFCANACHTVMQPESVAYNRSSHARVPCAECHIGSGASWFVKAKISGLRQVVATARESYHRPIPPAITELRPARDTCEECHWPQRFYGAQLKEFPHYASDEENTNRTVTLLLNIGGGDETKGHASGIHRHMALSGKIEYIATDERLQTIPWFTWTDHLGVEHIFRDDGKPSSDPPPEGDLRAIDCMDCHNRPAHEFIAPQVSVNEALSHGRVDASLPYVKRQMVEALLPPYMPTKEQALLRIGDRLSRFYQNNYPELWESRRASIYQAIDAARDIYTGNVFEYMNVDWRTYPDNIGHMDFPGCFRCHDSKHVNGNGEVLNSSCDVCHTFLNAETDGEEGVMRTGSFEHAMSLDGPHSSVRCDQCHSGGAAPQKGSCEGCHTAAQGLISATLPQLQAFEIEPDIMDELVACEDCHDTSAPHSQEAALQSCAFCHDDDGSYEAMVLEDIESLTALRAQVERQIDASDKDEPWAWRAREILDLLADAGPHHNAEGSRKVLERLATRGGSE